MTANGRHRAGDGATLGLAELDEAIALTIRVHSELIRTRELLGEDTPKPGLIEGPDALFRPTGYPVSEAEYEEAAERVVNEQPEQPWWPWPEWATDDLQRQLHQLHLPIIGTVPSFDEAHHRTDRATARFILSGLIDSGWQLSRVTSIGDLS